MGDIKTGRRLTIRGSFAVVAATFVLLTSCAMPPPAPSLHEALLQETGYQLGEESAKLKEERAECAAESRYDGPAGPVLVLVCVAPQNGEDRRIRYRISYTPPEAGHQIWKIDASIPGATYQQLDTLKMLAEKYGPGRKLKASETRRWTFDTAHLEVRQDQYGVHFMLWDRSLRQG